MLTLACKIPKEERESIAGLLLSFGAKVDSKNEQNETPLLLAEYNNDEKLQNLFNCPSQVPYLLSEGFLQFEETVTVKKPIKTLSDENQSTFDEQARMERSRSSIDIGNLFYFISIIFILAYF